MVKGRLGNGVFLMTSRHLVDHVESLAARERAGERESEREREREREGERVGRREREGESARERAGDREMLAAAFFSCPVATLSSDKPPLPHEIETLTAAFFFCSVATSSTV